ncbi:glycoside hydrolase [Xylariaceae sp. FL0804]|nr:glycoside hydrolase [Xylariaceae sp. FL0804]
MKATVAAVLLAAAAEAHYTLPNVDGTAQWSSVRQTTNWETNNPVTDVTSSAIRCYELDEGESAPDTTAVTAGGTITIDIPLTLYHPGALSAYMAQVPSGSTAADWDGDGTVWFKIYQDLPTVSNGQYVWPSQNEAKATFTIPACLANGDYLFRTEHVALHVAESVGGAQFYLSCAQVTVSGGSGAGDPSDLVAFPGAYNATDPGLLINIYNNGGAAYQPAGPSVFSC